MTASIYPHWKVYSRSTRYMQNSSIWAWVGSTGYYSNVVIQRRRWNPQTFIWQLFDYI